MKTIHKLDNMTTKQLKRLVLGICVVDSTKQLKKIIPMATALVPVRIGTPVNLRLLKATAPLTAPPMAAIMGLLTNLKLLMSAPPLMVLRLLTAPPPMAVSIRNPTSLRVLIAPPLRAPLTALRMVSLANQKALLRAGRTR